MSFLEQFLLWLKNFFFPRDCALCGGSLTAAGEMRCGLCADCGAYFTSLGGNRCNLCGKPLISERDFCLSCRNGQGRSYDRLWVLFPYTGKYRKLLAAYKFAGNLCLADFFAEKILEVIAGEPVLQDAFIVPVPPRPGKIKDNGWDQIECLVKRLEKREKTRICRCLKRSKSKIQKRLSRTERLENLKGRIYARGTAPHTALVIDDVITTGSTMEVCSSVLRENGAQKVYGLCLFYD